MIKKNNKGFTLLELLISIFILTTVIFIGYRVINKSTIDIKNQSNINKGQLTVNDMNKYLTKDLERARNVSLSSNYLMEQNTFTDDSTQENTITNNKKLKEAFGQYLEDTENDLSTDEKFIYSYNIDYKKDENNTEKITYNVKIIKDKNNYKYSILREGTNEVLITFITNEILTEEVLSRDDKLPFTIGLDSPYEVTLGYAGKNNDEFVEHQFVVASRLHDLDGGGNGSTGPGNGGGDGSTGSGSGGNGDGSIGSGEASDYLNYCLNKAQSYINKLGNNDISNLINEIFKISLKEKYDSNDLDSMDNYADKLIENINNIRNNCDKQYLDNNQQNLNGAEYYLNVVKSILDNFNNQNNNIDRNHLNNIINIVSQTLKYKCLTSYPDGAKNKIVALKAAIKEQKNISNNNSTPIGSQVDKQVKIIDNYELNFDNKIVSDRIDKMWSMLDLIVLKTWQTDNIDNDINELSQFINDTIDIIIEFEISLKTYIYNNIPICDNIPSDLINKINLCAEDVILKMNEANEILVSIKAQLNRVNYIKINN